MLEFSPSLIKKVVPVLSIFSLIPLMVFAGPPDNGPDGIPPGGRFSVYFTNIIQGNDGVSGACPTDQVIIGFNTGLTLNYGKPICRRMITLPDALTGQTLRNTGTGWVVNSLLYNNGTNIGINTTNPATKLDVNGSLFTRGAQAHYDMSLANAGATQWVKVGTLTAPQNGVNATLRFYGGSGYNASGSQIGDAVVEFRTSNGASVNASGFCASSIVKRSGRTQVFTNIKIVGNATGCSATSYDVYILAAAFIGRSYYTVDTDYGTTWSHVLAVGQADPGVASSTVLIPDFENVINENLSVIGNQTVSGNLGVGTPTPGYKLDVSGTGNFTGLRLPTGAGNTYILTSDASGNARWLANNYVESDPQVGANTTNYLSKWNGTALVTSQVFDNGTNVGIGTATPANKFQINTALGRIGFTSAGSEGSVLKFFSTGGQSTANIFNYGGDNETLNLEANGRLNVNGNIILTTNGTGRVKVDPVGNVGIGTTSPGQKLDVSGGSIRTTNQLISTLATGTAPLAVSSTTVNTNLNADLLDGYTTGNASGNIPLSNGTVNTNLNADMTDGLHVNSTTTNNEVNKIVRTDASGYANFGWINTTSGDNGTTAISRIYASSDGYIRYYTPANFKTNLSLVDRSAGTLNYIPKWTPDGDTLGNSQIFDNGTNVGIGTASPGAKLDVSGTGQFTGLRLPTGASSGYILTSDSLGNAQWQIPNDSTGGLWRNIPLSNTTKYDPLCYYQVRFAENGTGTYINNLYGSGNVWVNVERVTENFLSLIIINGSPQLSYGVPSSAKSTYGYRSSDTGIFVNMPEYPIQEMRFLCNIFTGTGLAEDDPQVGTITTNYLSKWNGSALVTSQVFDNGTNMGIGTATPGYKLDVSGTGQFTGLRIPTGAGNNYILASDASGNARWASSSSTETDPIWMAQKGSYATNTGVGASGTWGINVTGNAATATSLQTARTIGINGRVTGTPTSFSGGGNITINTTAVNATSLNAYTQGNASGNIPLSNGTVNTNLNADLLDGQSIAYFAPISSPTFTGTPTLPTGSIGVTQAAGNSTTALATTAFVTTADNLKANLASPALSGTPTAPTAAIATNTTQIATTAYVKSQGYITAGGVPAAETDPQVGANTTNYFSKWNGTALVAGQVFDNGTNIGIGTATPGAKLDVNGSASINGDLTVVGKVITDTLVNRTVAQLTVSGSILPNATSSQKDLGANGNRWANLWLSGNATIGGNANVTGSVTAGSFAGNGSAITSLSPANISAGTAGISITGNAATATNATTATTASAAPWSGITGKPTTIAGYGISDIGSYAPSLTGVGASGTWGINITGNAATATNATNAGNADTTDGYHMNQNVLTTSSPTFAAATIPGNLYVSTANTTGGGIKLADDGDIVDLNDGFAAMRFSNGVRIHAGNSTGGPVITLASNGQVTASQFNGALNGNASSATNATNATNAGNADTTDGFHMNQNVLTTSSPTFNSLTTSSTISVGGTSSQLLMQDNDESTGGPKSVHANSNVIGFLRGAGSWITYWDNSGNQNNGGQVTATQFNGPLNGNASSATNATNATNAGNADTTDGFHMNQNVLTTSSPAFNYVNASNSTRLGEIWGHGGLYRSSGEMMFGTEGGNWRFHSGNSQKAIIATNGNLWMEWAGDWLSNLLGAKANHRAEGAGFVDYSRYVYDNGAYQGAGWKEPSSLGVAYAATAGSAYPTRVGGVVMQFNWSGQGGQPNWLWGGGDGTNMYVYNPSNFSVNYANSAGTANAVSFNGGLTTSSAPTFAEVTATTYRAAGSLHVQAGGAGNLYLNPWNGSAVYIGGGGGNGQLYAQGYSYYSDKRLKENLHIITGSLDRIQKINGYTFDWKNTGKRDLGVIAQEVEKVFPELVGLATSSSGETNKTVEYGNLVAPLIEAVKELKTEKDREIRSLQEENSLLKSENESIKTRLELLEKAVLNSKQ